MEVPQQQLIFLEHGESIIFQVTKTFWDKLTNFTESSFQMELKDSILDTLLMQLNACTIWLWNWIMVKMKLRDG
jgi:hypothetical protein